MPSLPTEYETTRRSLHLVLFYAVSKARQDVEGEVWSVPHPGGFGTPPFDGGRVLRVDGADLVAEQDGDEVAREPISTLDAAMVFCGVEWDRARGERNDIEVPDRTDEALSVDVDASAAIAEWFGLGWDVLERVLERAHFPDDTERRLWNEHFDLAIEVGSEADKARAAVGFSPGDPGDSGIGQPYAYVAPWFKDETREALQPTHSFGVAIRRSDVADSADPADEIDRFLTGALRRIGAL